MVTTTEETVNFRFFGDSGQTALTGRLVMIVERILSEDSRRALRNLLGELRWRDEVTMVAGLTRASVLQAGDEGHGMFYNRREFISPEQAFALLPWREIWLVAAGRVWRLEAE